MVRSGILYTPPHCPRSGSRKTKDGAFNILPWNSLMQKNTTLLCNLNYNAIILDFEKYNLLHKPRK